MFVPFFFTPGCRGVHIHGLTGIDEISVGENNTPGLLAFLKQLDLKGSNGEEFDVAMLVTADRDRLLARLHIYLYGEKISSTLDCTKCSQKFDLDFSLENLLTHFLPDSTMISEDGIYETASGIRFRLPTGTDEMAVKGFDRENAERILLERCMINGDPAIDGEMVQLKMAEVAPVLSQEMSAECPECGNLQQVLFDMQSFLLTKLIQDKKMLHKEIHIIASQYHWSHNEILALPRDSRKQYAVLIGGD